MSFVDKLTRMRISFDLDDTLICYQPGVSREPGLPWYLRWLGGNEPLRSGAVELMRRLRQSGWEIWIYTTSLRSPSSVRCWLWCHGIQVVQVINQRIHDATLRHTPEDYAPSKNPGAFGIDLHVDDSFGVRVEGERFGFNVVLISPENERWTELVLSAAAEFQCRQTG